MQQDFGLSFRNIKKLTGNTDGSMLHVSDYTDLEKSRNGT